MLIAGDALAKTIAKSQKIIFWSQKNNFDAFFWLTGDDLRAPYVVLTFT